MYNENCFCFWKWRWRSSTHNYRVIIPVCEIVRYTLRRTRKIQEKVDTSFWYSLHPFHFEVRKVLKNIKCMNLSAVEVVFTSLILWPPLEIQCECRILWRSYITVCKEEKTGLSELRITKYCTTFAFMTFATKGYYRKRTAHKK